MQADANALEAKFHMVRLIFGPLLSANKKRREHTALKYLEFTIHICRVDTTVEYSRFAVFESPLRRFAKTL